MDAADGRRLYAERQTAKARGEDLAMPRDQRARIRAGQYPIWVIREHRGFTQPQLAERSALDRSLISIIENGKRDGKVSNIKAIAWALGAPLDVVVGDWGIAATRPPA